MSAFAEAREFIRGAARNKELCYLISRGKELLRNDVAPTSMVAVYRGDWADAANTPWNATAIAVARRPAEQAILVGEDGEAISYAAGKSTPEVLRPTPVAIRNARTIDGEVYACGMKRQVYRRSQDGTWRDVSAPAPKRDENAGFEAIDGFGHGEIYAVGWSGELWQYDQQKWTQRTTKVSSILTAVCCAADGNVYVAGQNGIVLRGRNDKWNGIQWKGKAPDADVWDLCWYDDTLFVSTSTGLFTLTGNKLVAAKGCDLTSCFSLTTTDGVLWSIGPHQVASFDGATWRRYE